MSDRAKEFKIIKFEKLAIAINVHRESRGQLFACLDRIVRNLPGAKIQVFGNDSCHLLKQLCFEMGISFIDGANLGNNTYWYLWWRRMLEWFVASDCDALLKLDPDTMVDRPPSWIPESDYFGCIDHWFVQGGCTGISKRLAVLLLESGMLTPSGASRVHVTHRAFADDKYMGRMIIDLGISPFAWTEVKSQWRVPVLNENLEFSIVHPRYYD